MEDLVLVKALEFPKPGIESKKLFLLYRRPYRVKEIRQNAYLLKGVDRDQIIGTSNIRTLKAYYNQIIDELNYQLRIVHLQPTSEEI